MTHADSVSPIGGTVKYPKVGSAAIVIDTCGRLGQTVNTSRILLGQRGKEPNFGRWVMPGGKVELLETIDAAAEREVREETGLVVKVTHRLGIFEILDPPEHSVFVLSLAHVISGTLKAGDDIMDVRWVTRDELPDVDLSDPCRAALTTVGWIQHTGRSGIQIDRYGAVEP